MPEGATINVSRAMLPAGFTLLQVVPALDAGGVETLTLDVAGAAAGAGARSLVASRGGRLEAELKRRGGELIRLPLHARDPLSLYFNARRLERVIGGEKVSVVHARSRGPAFSALAAARRTGVPIVTTYHGIYAAASPLKRWYNSVMTRGDAVIANSAFTRGHILGEHAVAPEKVVVIPEGVDTGMFNPAAVPDSRVAAARAAWGLGESDARPIILLPARLAAWKGHEVIIAALARGPARKDFVLVFTADGAQGPHGVRLGAEAGAAGIDLRFALTGADMPAALRAADLVVAPSTSAESFGRAVAEAGAMGKVVIASRLGGPAETIVDGQTGWLAAAGDVDAWTAAIERALAMSPPDLAAMGAAARARIERLYSLTRMCKDTFSLYLRVLQSGGGVSAP
ncbi:MAG TPA: glycosyltransferase family 4 protein [Caulobacteraceae bacterium]|jgi:glycosyltransferase involved in cell wall biosynthesis